jgi:hypothetical protein
MKDKRTYVSRYSRHTIPRLLGLTVVIVIMICGFGITPSYGQVQTEHFRFADPVEFSFIPACSTDPPLEVFFTGTVRTQGNIVNGPNGEFLHGTFQQLLTNMRGVDAQGGQWVFTDTEHGTSNVNNGGTVFTTTGHGVVRNLGSGQDFNTVITIVTHQVINPDGTIKLDIVNVNIQCTGQPGEPT